MNIIVISDLHGKSCWSEIKIDLYDKVVFLGDYVDAFHKTDEEIITNLQNIIKFKKDNIDKVYLLIANHDIQYINPQDPNKCSGYRPSCAIILQQIFADNYKLFQMAYLYEDYLFTHAGVSTFWWNNFVERSKYIEYMSIFNKAEILNELFNTGDRLIFNDNQGPLWIRPGQLTDPLYGYHQIVGHTHVKDFIRVGDNKTSVVYCDVLDTKTDFLILDI